MFSLLLRLTVILVAAFVPPGSERVTMEWNQYPLQKTGQLLETDVMGARYVHH